jgi:dinuclear metal center YbgI/SA1388 family protein
MRIDTAIRFLDSTLQIREFHGDSSLNGLQVEGSRNITRVALAVDACERSMKRAIRQNADLLVVHHGLFWGEASPITGIMARRVGLLLENGLSLYAAHLPLDAHPEIGNNAQLAGLLGIENHVPFGMYHGREIGLLGRLPRAVAPRTLARKIAALLATEVKTLDFGPSRISTLGIVSGGGAFLAQEASRSGCDGLLTGEQSHSAYHTARESRITLIHAGHYATETLGLMALGALIEAELGLETRFIDIPTGL